MARLEALAHELAARGTDPRVLRQLELELEVLERPPGLLTRLRQQVREMARRNAERLAGEISESREMAAIVRRRLAKQPVSDTELALVREQMLDLARMLPAAVIAATNYTLPIPGSSLLTPWMLAKLGLLPTRWREAYVLKTLHDEAERLRASGHEDLAARVEDLERQVEREADARAVAAHDAALLTHWDTNRDGLWQDSEREAYRAEVARLAARYPVMGDRQRWFLQAEGRIFGPVSLTPLEGMTHEVGLLACLDGRSGWVDLADLFTAIHRARVAEPPPPH